MGLRLRKPRAEAGFSLVEAAIAMLIIGIALVPTSRLWVSNAQANQAIGRKAEALLVAQQVLEREVRGKSFESLPTSPLSGDEPASGLQYELVLTPVAGFEAGLKRAEVRVWQAGQAEIIVRLVTLAAKES